MGCTHSAQGIQMGSVVLREGPLDQDQLNARLKQDAAVEAASLKILALGATGAGTSTLAWQLMQWSSPPPGLSNVHHPQVGTAMLAFCMASHKRLGANSPASELPPEIMVRIRDFVEVVPPRGTGTLMEHRLEFGVGHTGAGCACRVFDIDGQSGPRGETTRRKWLHCFDDVDAVFFVIDLTA